MTKDEKPVEETVEETPQNIKIGEDEYSLEEAQSLLEKGKFAKEVETKYNTDLSKVWPDYTRKSQELKNLQAEMEELKKPAPEPIDQEDPVVVARQQAKKLGLLLEDELPERFDKYYKERYEKDKAVENLMSDTKSLLNTVKSEGKPLVEEEDLLKFMAEEGIRSPEKAYKLLKEEELDKWKMEKISSAKKPGLYTEKTSIAGSKEPKEVKVTNDNIDDMLSEALHSQF